MTYEEIVAKVKKEFGSADVSKYEGHLALQINITGEGSGAFYAEINDGQLFIEPFDYKDNDAILTASGEDIVNILSGNLGAVKLLKPEKLQLTVIFQKHFLFRLLLKKIKSLRLLQKREQPRQLLRQIRKNQLRLLLQKQQNQPRRP